jgi:cystathionine beta-lyase/cystathionine gamma-synthase
MERHYLSGLEVAKFLEAHPRIIKVNHPLLNSSLYRPLTLVQQKGRHSGMLAFYIKGGKEAAVKFLDEIKIIKRAASLGGTHAMLTEGERETSGISSDLVRLSVGLESLEDLLADLDQALKKTV